MKKQQLFYLKFVSYVLLIAFSLSSSVAYPDIPAVILEKLTVTKNSDSHLTRTEAYASSFGRRSELRKLMGLPLERENASVQPKARVIDLSNTSVIDLKAAPIIGMDFLRHSKSYFAPPLARLELRSGDDKTGQLARLGDSYFSMKLSILILAAGFLSAGFGIGGGILIVPSLVLFFKMDMKKAVATSFGAILPISIVGFLTHLVASPGAFSWPLLYSLPILAGSLVSMYFGTEYFKKIKSETLKKIFAIFLMIIGIKYLLFSGEGKQWTTVIENIQNPFLFYPSLVLMGLIGGITAALFGVGGGVLYVPALNLLYGFPFLRAVTMSFVVIIPNNIYGFLKHQRLGLWDERVRIAVILLPALIGATLGAFIVHKVPESLVAKSFGIFLSIMSFWLLVRKDQKSRPDSSDVISKNIPEIPKRSELRNNSDFSHRSELRSVQPQERTLIDQTAKEIQKAFDRYWSEYKKITERSKENFDTQNWVASVSDGEERIRLYPKVIDEIQAQVAGILGDKAQDDFTWHFLRDRFLELVFDRYEADLALIFFYSVKRRFFLDTDESVEYQDDGISEGRKRAPTENIARHYGRYSTSNLGEMIQNIIEDYDFKAPFQNLEEDSLKAAKMLESDLEWNFGSTEFEAIQMLEPVFYRNKGAYLVGRVMVKNEWLPFVLPLLHSDSGITIDAVLTDEASISNVFSFTRSNFHVGVDYYRELLDFLETILPRKGKAALQSAIGFVQPAKLQLTRELRHHLKRTKEQFVETSGTKGWVMATFTTPSFPYVFKVIADHSEKEMTSREGVMGKYRLVHSVDRVGRMLDAMVFRNIEFDTALFPKELLQELMGRAPSSVIRKNGHVLFKHLYVQRKTIPLDYYIKQVADPRKIEKVLIDLGWCIKELAAAGIWVGDLKLKNFGVTEHSRVVSYDYDELGKLTDYEFIDHLPPHMPAGEDEPSYRDSDYMDRYIYKRVPVKRFVWEMEIPDQFKSFFENIHNDLFTVEFWEGMQAKIKEKRIADWFPYPQNRRLRQTSVSTSSIQTDLDYRRRILTPLLRDTRTSIFNMDSQEHMDSALSLIYSGFWHALKPNEKKQVKSLLMSHFGLLSTEWAYLFGGRFLNASFAFSDAEVAKDFTAEDLNNLVTKMKENAEKRFLADPNRRYQLKKDFWTWDTSGKWQYQRLWLGPRGGDDSSFEEFLQALQKARRDLYIELSHAENQVEWDPKNWIDFENAVILANPNLFQTLSAAEKRKVLRALKGELKENSFVPAKHPNSDVRLMERKFNVVAAISLATNEELWKELKPEQKKKAVHILKKELDSSNAYYAGVALLKIGYSWNEQERFDLVQKFLRHAKQKSAISQHHRFHLAVVLSMIPALWYGLDEEIRQKIVETLSEDFDAAGAGWDIEFLVPAIPHFWLSLSPEQKEKLFSNFATRNRLHDEPLLVQANIARAAVTFVAEDDLRNPGNGNHNRPELRVDDSTRAPIQTFNAPWKGDGKPVSAGAEEYHRVTAASWYTNGFDILARYAEIAKLKPGQVAVGLGVGTGATEHWWMERFPNLKDVKIIGVDVSTSWMRKAHELLKPYSNIDLYLMRGPKGEFLNVAETLGVGAQSQVDLVYSANVVHVISEKELERAFQGVKEILKPGGKFVISSGGVLNPDPHSKLLNIHDTVQSVRSTALVLLHHVPKYQEINAQLKRYDPAETDETIQTLRLIFPKERSASFYVERLRKAGFMTQAPVFESIDVKNEDWTRFLSAEPLADGILPELKDYPDIRKEIIGKALDIIFPAGGSFQAQWMFLAADVPEKAAVSETRSELRNEGSEKSFAELQKNGSLKLSHGVTNPIFGVRFQPLMTQADRIMNRLKYDRNIGSIVEETISLRHHLISFIEQMFRQPKPLQAIFNQAKIENTSDVLSFIFLLQDFREAVVPAGSRILASVVSRVKREDIATVYLGHRAGGPGFVYSDDAGKSEVDWSRGSRLMADWFLMYVKRLSGLYEIQDGLLVEKREGVLNINSLSFGARPTETGTSEIHVVLKLSRLSSTLNVMQKSEGETAVDFDISAVGFSYTRAADLLLHELPLSSEDEMNETLSGKNPNRIIVFTDKEGIYRKLDLKRVQQFIKETQPSFKIGNWIYQMGKDEITIRHTMSTRVERSKNPMLYRYFLFKTYDRLGTTLIMLGTAGWDLWHFRLLLDNTLNLMQSFPTTFMTDFIHAPMPGGSTAIMNRKERNMFVKLSDGSMHLPALTVEEEMILVSKMALAIARQMLHKKTDEPVLALPTNDEFFDYDDIFVRRSELRRENLQVMEPITKSQIRSIQTANAKIESAFQSNPKARAELRQMFLSHEALPQGLIGMAFSRHDAFEVLSPEVLVQLADLGIPIAVISPTGKEKKWIEDLNLDRKEKSLPLLLIASDSHNADQELRKNHSEHTMLVTTELAQIKVAELYFNFIEFLPEQNLRAWANSIPGLTEGLAVAHAVYESLHQFA